MKISRSIHLTSVEQNFCRAKLTEPSPIISKISNLPFKTKSAGGEAAVNDALSLRSVIADFLRSAWRKNCARLPKISWLSLSRTRDGYVILYRMTTSLNEII